MIDRLEDKIDRLAAYPRLGSVYPDLDDNLRRFTVGQYILFYEPLPDGIRLIRVLHGARDIPGVLSGR